MAVTSPWLLRRPAQFRGHAHPRAWLWRTLMAALDQQDTPASRPKVNTYETFEDLIAGRESDIFGYLWRLTGDEQAAYDLCQETFLRAWQQFGKVQHYDQPGAWLYRVATNLALNAIERRSRTTGRVVQLHEDQHPSVEDASGHIARLDLIHKTLLQLSARERIALVLREVEGFSNSEIAQALEISANSVRMLLSRARAHFRQHYANMEAQP